MVRKSKIKSERSIPTENGTRYELYEVEWLDAYEESAGWHSIADAKKMRPKPVNSVGYVIDETEDYIILAGDLDPRLLKGLSEEEIRKILDDSDCGRLTVIPGQWKKSKYKVK